MEPEDCRALNAAIEAGRPVDVPVRSIASDSLGARRATALALHAAQRDGVRSVLVAVDEIARARRSLWDHRRVAVEEAAATALAALTAPDRPEGGGLRLPARQRREDLRRPVRGQHRPVRPRVTKRGQPLGCPLFPVRSPDPRSRCPATSGRARSRPGWRRRCRSARSR
ncbi:pyridoxal-phosphate dependent enzyme [Streptomyces sp. NPDC058195]|uniref:pyridoxal-phosphate dependent enzyme n=1 Tax=Streptomyces sp. NPDC058195 TaxID=3346375 RepID=UPI0036E593AA